MTLDEARTSTTPAPAEVAGPAEKRAWVQQTLCVAPGEKLIAEPRATHAVSVVVYASWAASRAVLLHAGADSSVPA